MKAFLVTAAVLVLISALIQLIMPGFFNVPEPNAVQRETPGPADEHFNILMLCLYGFETLGVCFAISIVILIMCKKFAGSQRQALSGMSVAVLMSSMSLPQFVMNALSLIHKFMQ